MSDTEYPDDQWVYRNESDGNVVYLPKRNSRLDHLPNWTLLSSPKEPDAGDDPANVGTAGAEDTSANQVNAGAAAGAAQAAGAQLGAADAGDPDDPMQVNVAGPAVAVIPNPETGLVTPAGVGGDVPAAVQPAPPEAGDPGTVEPVQVEGDQVADGEGPPRPKDSDVKPMWVDYALARDTSLTREQAEEMTKPELIKKYGK